MRVVARQDSERNARHTAPAKADVVARRELRRLDAREIRRDADRAQLVVELVVLDSC
jgi:hypothetical protein